MSSKVWHALFGGGGFQQTHNHAVNAPARVQVVVEADRLAESLSLLLAVLLT